MAANNTKTCFISKKKLKIYVYRADINTLDSVGAIVNAPDGELIQRDQNSRIILRLSPPQGPAQIIVTKSDKLPCKAVYDIAIQKFMHLKDDDDGEKYFSQFTQMVKTVLSVADGGVNKSIALTPMRSKTYGALCYNVASSLVNAILNYEYNSTIREIHVVDTKEEVLRYVNLIISRYLKNHNYTSDGDDAVYNLKLDIVTQPDSASYEDSNDHEKAAFNFRDVRVYVYRADISRTKLDVDVSVTADNKRVVDTRGGKSLKESFVEALINANKKSPRSIALLSGSYELSNRNVAYDMYDAILHFISVSGSQSPREIHVVDILGDSVLGHLIGLLRATTYKLPGTRKRILAHPVMYATDKCPSKAAFKVGSVHRVYIFSGDITKIKVDAIMNTTDKDLKHERGQALTIAVAAGEKYRKVCRDMSKSINELNKFQIVQTSAGNLPCNYVIHILSPVWRKDDADASQDELRRMLLGVIKHADKQNCKKIAISTTSMAENGVPHQDIANALVQAIVKFAMTNSNPTLQNIYLVDSGKYVVPHLNFILQHGDIIDFKSNEKVRVKPKQFEKIEKSSAKRAKHDH